MLANPKHLQRCLNEMFNPVESNTIDCIYKAYYWMEFSVTNQLPLHRGARIALWLPSNKIRGWL